MMKGASGLLILILYVSSAATANVSNETEVVTTTETSPSVQQPPWQKSTTSLADRARYLLDSGEYSDVNVTIGNRTFQLHRTILAMTSHVFAEKLYPENQVPPVTVTLTENIKPTTFKQVLEYIYKDEVDLSSMGDTWELWRAAVVFQMDDLLQKTAKHINTSINVENVLEAFEKAVQNNESNMQAMCMEIIHNSTAVILMQPYFLQLSERNVKLIVGSPLLNATEAQIFQGILQWAKTSMWKKNVTQTPDTLRHHLRHILPLLDLDDMTPDEFVAIVEPTGVLTAESSNLRLRAMLKKMLPTGEVSKTRRSSREVTCLRWKNDEVESRGNYRTSAPQQDHILKFKVTCGSPQCFLISLGVTKSFASSVCSYIPLPIFFTLSVADSGEELVSLKQAISKPYDIHLPKPVALKDGGEYRIYISTESFNSDGNEYRYCLSQPISRYDHISRGGRSWWRGLQHSGDCNVNTECGKVIVTFMNDPNSVFTNVNRGLVTSLVFVQ